MASEPIKNQNRINVGEGVELDPNSDELWRAGRVYKLERIPATLLLLLIERRGQVVRREEIVERVWGKSVFLDTDNSINSAVRKVRLALKDDPESPRFIQTISGRGYRLIGQTDAIESPAPGPNLASSVPPEIPSRVDPTASLERSHVKRVHVLLAGITLLSIATAGWLLNRSAKSAAHPSIHSLAVLPLKNLSADPTQEYLADGMTESIIGRLSGIRELRVISRTSVMRFKDAHLSVPEIARQLGVDAMVEGSVIRDGDRIRVHAQLIRAATDAHFWSETYDRDLEDVLSLESEIAQSIADKVKVTVSGEERERLARVPSVSPEVYENYLKGRFALEKSNGRADIEKSIAFFQRAIDKDPNFAPAYLGLSDAYIYLSSIFIGVRPEEVRPKAIDAARKALELDPRSVEALVHLAGMHQVQWHWTEAESEFRRALELNPNSAAAHSGLAGWLMCQGRTDEALAQARRARELDPLEVSGDDISTVLFFSHRFPEAIQESRSAVALRPDDPGVLWGLGFALIANDQPTEAVSVLEKALSVSDRSPGIMGVLIRAYAHAGRRPDAFQLLSELKRRQQSGYVPAGAFVNAYVGLGDNEQALVWLEKAYQEHSNILQYLKVHPYLDPLRSDPRFQNLVHRVGLE